MLDNAHSDSARAKETRRVQFADHVQRSGLPSAVWTFDTPQEGIVTGATGLAHAQTEMR